MSSQRMDNLGAVQRICVVEVPDTKGTGEGGDKGRDCDIWTYEAKAIDLETDYITLRAMSG